MMYILMKTRQNSRTPLLGGAHPHVPRPGGEHLPALGGLLGLCGHRRDPAGRQVRPACSEHPRGLAPAHRSQGGPLRLCRVSGSRAPGTSCGRRPLPPGLRSVVSVSWEDCGENLPSWRLPARGQGSLGAPLARAFALLQAEAQGRAALSSPHGGLGQGVPLPRGLRPLGWGPWGRRALVHCLILPGSTIACQVLSLWPRDVVVLSSRGCL